MARQSRHKDLGPPPPLPGPIQATLVTDPQLIDVHVVDQVVIVKIQGVERLRMSVRAWNVMVEIARIRGANAQD